MKLGSNGVEIKDDVAISRRNRRCSFPSLKNPTTPGTPRGPSDSTGETGDVAHSNIFSRSCFTHVMLNKKRVTTLIPTPEHGRTPHDQIHQWDYSPNNCDLTTLPALTHTSTVSHTWRTRATGERRMLRKTLSFLSSQRIQDTNKTRESKAGRRALATYELPRAQSPRNEDVATSRSKDLPTAAPEGLEPNFLSKGALQYQMVDVFGSLRTEGTGII
jgi:hypothetical protein